jgi:hypothetical protein
MTAQHQTSRRSHKQSLITARSRQMNHGKNTTPYLNTVAGVLNREQLKALQAILNHERKEQLAQFDREMKQSDAMIEIMSGLPRGTVFYDACVIKAAQGHALARQALNKMNSREHRTYNALFDAAVDAHPGWKRDDNEQGVYVKSKDDAPEDHALVEWFQTTYPREARAIEDAIT